jgi:NAD(P)-dependent dehydrogenase (short-subunit alcohol dehydrogenase family)
VARRFAKAYPVVLLARSPSSYRPVAEEINANGGHALGISTDLTDSKSVSAAFEEIKQKFPDTALAAAIFNPGGRLVRKPFLEITEDEFVEGALFQGKAGYLFATAALPLLLKGTDLELPPTLIFTGSYRAKKMIPAPHTT